MNKLNLITKKINPGYLFTLPWIIGFLLLIAYPLIESLQYSFNQVSIGPLGAILFPVGIQNYMYIFTLDPKFTQALVAVSKEIILMIPLTIILSMIIALILSRDIRFKSFLRTLFFIPVIIMSGPILTLMDEISALTDYDELSDILMMMFSQPDNAVIMIFISIIIFLITNISLILRFCGIPIVVFLVVIQRINPDLYEAADIDGAGPWNKFWKVTLPSIKMAININILYLVVQMSALESNSVSEQIKNNMFDIEKGLGYSAAQAWIYLLVLFAIIGILLLLVNGIKRGGKR